MIDDCLFSKQIPASVSRYQACPKWLCAHGTTQHYSGASGHKWTVWTISTFVDIVHCWNMKLSSSLIHNTIVQASYNLFINATSRQQISVYSILIGLVICLLVPPTFPNVGVQKIFSHSITFCPPQFLNRDAAPVFMRPIGQWKWLDRVMVAYTCLLHIVDTVTLQLHNFDLFRTCTSSFCTGAWQLARFQLTRRIACRVVPRR